MARVSQPQSVRTVRMPRRRIVCIAQGIERVSRTVLVWLVAVGGLYGIYWGICENDLFALRHVVIRGQFAHVDEATLRDLADVATGTNLFRISLPELKARVARHPWVRACAVRRKLPDAVWIYVEEREPVALLHAGDLYLVDAAAKVFKPLAGGDPADFPVLSGITDVIVGSDGVGHSAQLEQLLQAWRQYDAHPIAETLGCSEVIRDHYGRVAIVTERPALVLRLGDTVVPEQLDRLFTILPTLAHGTRRAEAVDLGVDRRVVVRYAS